MDIITNKVTAEERRQCPHHMLDYLSPLQEHNTIVEFRNAAIPIIERILKDEKLPIVVGGTSYYIESLLWNFLINSQDVLNARKSESINLKSKASVDFENEQGKQIVSECDSMSLEPGLTSEEQGTTTHHISNSVGELILDDAFSSDESSSTESESEDTYSNQTLHKRLQKIDSETAKTIHPNDTRKVKRALEVYRQHGIPMSEILKAQRSGEGDLAKSGPLRYPHNCIFWIQSDKEVLNERINKRTDKMIEAGLVEELLDFHHQYNVARIKENSEVDYTLGIFQSIGFKEFHKYLILSPEERDTEKGRELLKEGIENLKQVTRKYARKQISRIKGRFLRRPGLNIPPVYGLDATDVSMWEENVYKPAISILTDVIEGKEPSIKPLPYQSEEVDAHVYRVCEACNKTLVTESQIKSHFSSKKHQKRMKSLRKRQNQGKENTKNMEPKQTSESEECSSDNDDGNPMLSQYTIIVISHYRSVLTSKFLFIHKTSCGHELLAFIELSNFSRKYK
ncbi:hypothetical protein KUTeg_017181 [Tegillarca granosa]|uniref:C2H2-type domain-containing protein n=1 Tax=Tegillarca granosa TaxID=220873 RepID=A0ABQ9EN11_TEGGR|nr:hypothetical protein KUTeg_017181 [Tegillarca granosa]